MPLFLGLPPVAGVVMAARSRPDALAETIRAVVQKQRAALVTVTLVLKTSMGGQSQNTELETEGVVLTADGLVAIMNAAIDPMAMMGREADMGEMRVSVRVISARLLTEDGQEITAKVVLRDPDKGIAFLRPVTPLARPLPFIDLKKPRTAQIGEPLVVLGRLGKSANRAPRVVTPRVIGIIEKPRTLYVTETFIGLLALGNVAFNEHGEALGIITLRNKTETATRTTMDMSRGMLPVVVPGEDIWEAAAQAPAARDVKDEPEPVKKPAKTPPAPPKKPIKK